MYTGPINDLQLIYVVSMLPHERIGHSFGCDSCICRYFSWKWIKATWASRRRRGKEISRYNAFCQRGLSKVGIVGKNFRVLVFLRLWFQSFSTIVNRLMVNLSSGALAANAGYYSAQLSPLSCQWQGRVHMRTDGGRGPAPQIVYSKLCIYS